MKSTIVKNNIAFFQGFTLLLSSLLFFLIIFHSPPTDAHAAAEQSKSKSLTPVTLQLRWFHQFQFAGYYAAKAKGFYEEAGLDVTIKERDAATDPVTEVLAGRAQFGVANSEVLVHALDGKPLSVLAAIFQHSPMALLVPGVNDLITPHDLIGHRVKMSRQIRDVELQAMFLHEGMTLDQLDIVDDETRQEDYLNPTVSAMGAYITNEPYYLEQRSLPYHLIQPRQYGIDFYGDCLFTNQVMYDEEHDVVHAFTRASLRGWEYALDHPQEIIDLILTDYSNKKPRAHLEYEAEKLRQLILPGLLEMGHMNPGRWQSIAQTYADLGLVDPKRINAEFFDGFVHDLDRHQEISYLHRKVRILWLIICIGASVMLTLLLVTRRMRREIRRRKDAEQALKQSEAFHRILFERTGTCTVVAEKDGTITMANEQCESLFKLPNEQLVNHYRWQDFVHPDDLERMIAINKNRLEGNDAPSGYTFRLIDSDGEIRHIHISVGKLLDSAQIICSLNDLTPRFLAEQERELVIGELEVKNEELERFAYTVSHDLKSPLITIKGFLGILQEALEEQDAKLTNESIRRISTASDTMLSLLNELLELSRIGRVNSIPRRSSMSEIARMAAERVQGVLEQRNASVTIAPNLPEILCDKERITEVFQNLFENAARYGAAQGPTLIEVGYRQDRTDEGVQRVFFVRDNGMGIAPQYTERIFKLFEQLNPCGDGTGVGLTLVRRIIEHHGGSIWAESEGLGRGSTFCFTLGTPKS